MPLNTCKMWSNGIKTAFFFKKSSSGWGLRPQNPLWDTFKWHKFTWSVSHFCYLTWGISHLPLAKSWLSARTKSPLLIFYFTISLSHKKFLCWIFLMTSLHVIWCLPPPPNQKSWLHLSHYCRLLFFKVLKHFTSPLQLASSRHCAKLKTKNKISRN